MGPRKWILGTEIRGFFHSQGRKVIERWGGLPFPFNSRGISISGAQAATMAVGWQVNDRRRLHHYASILTLYSKDPGEIKSVLERFLRKSPGHFYGIGVVVGVNF